MSEYNEGGQPCESCGYPPQAGHSSDCPKNSANEQKAPEQKPRKLTPEETFKVTTNAFKDALDPKAAIKKAKKFFGK